MRDVNYMRAKNARGRPRVDSEEIRSRLPRDLLDGIDAFAADATVNPDRPSRPEAIRRIIREYLTSIGLLRPQ